MKSIGKVLFVLIFLMVPWQARAQVLNARFSTSVYSWQNQNADSSESNIFRGYQTAMINVNDLGNHLGISNLSFNMYFQSWRDFSAKTTGDPAYRVYNFYLRWKSLENSADKWDVRVGRQQVLTGLRSPVIDGTRIDYTHSNDFTLMGFFGALPPTDGTISNLKPYERRSFGAKLSTSKFYGFNTSLTYVDKSRESPYYLDQSSTGVDSIVRPKIKERLAGFDAYRFFGNKVSWYGHAEYNMLEKNLQRASTDVQYSATSDLIVAAQYLYRRPQVMYNSFFSAVDELKSNREIWLRARYRIDESWSVNGEYANVFYSLKDAWRFGLGATYMRTGLSYNRRMGYGGTIDMISVSSYYPINSKFNTSGSVSFARFKLSDDISAGSIADAVSKQVLQNINTSMTAIGRINYELLRSFNVDFEAQFLSQNLKSSPVFGGNKYDVRLFVRANYWIFQKL